MPDQDPAEVFIALRFANRDRQLADELCAAPDSPGACIDELGCSALACLGEDVDGTSALPALQLTKTISARTNASRHREDRLREPDIESAPFARRLTMGTLPPDAASQCGTTNQGLNRKSMSLRHRLRRSALSNLPALGAVLRALGTSLCGTTLFPNKRTCQRFD